MEKLTRRRFIEMGACLAFGACTLKNEPRITPSPNSSNGSFDATTRLLKAILDLPETPLKLPLAERVLPYFAEESPLTINRSGLEIKVESVTVRTAEAISQLKADGSFTIRNNRVVTNYRVPEVTSMRVPYPGLLAQSEVTTADPRVVMQDGTVLATVNMVKHNPQFESMSPEIVVTPIYNPSINEEGQRMARAYEDFALVKEGFQLLLVDVQLEEIYKKMVQFNLPTKMTVEDKRNGKLLQIDAVYPMLEALWSFGGRLVAAHDLAGYVAVFKATEGTAANDYLREAGASEIKELAKRTEDVDLGNSPSEIYYKSMEWVLNNRQFLATRMTGYYKGVLSRFP